MEAIEEEEIGVQTDLDNEDAVSEYSNGELTGEERKEFLK
jgi:hypothetical protein